MYRIARELRAAPAFVAVLCCLGLLVAGCGGRSGVQSSRSDSALRSQPQEVSSYVAYAACLNKHRVEVQVARTGGLVWVAAPGVPGVRSPQALAAERDCESLAPRGQLTQRPTAAQTAENMALMLRFAKCMRAHGVTHFPDPTAQGLRFSPSSESGLTSPAFRAAEKSCQKYNLTIG